MFRSQMLELRVCSFRYKNHLQIASAIPLHHTGVAVVRKQNTTWMRKTQLLISTNAALYQIHDEYNET